MLIFERDTSEDSEVHQKQAFWRCGGQDDKFFRRSGHSEPLSKLFDWAKFGPFGQPAQRYAQLEDCYTESEQDNWEKAQGVHWEIEEDWPKCLHLNLGIHTYILYLYNLHIQQKHHFLWAYPWPSMTQALSIVHMLGIINYSCFLDYNIGNKYNVQIAWAQDQLASSVHIQPPEIDSGLFRDSLLSPSRGRNS